MNEELTLAIEELRQRSSDRSWFIPVLLSKCDLPERQIGAGETLDSIQHVPLYLDWNRGIATLLGVLGAVVPKARHEEALRTATERRIALLVDKLSEPEEDDNPYQPKLHATVKEIAEIGPAVVPYLVKQLRAKRFTSAILLCLREIGENADRAAPEIFRFWQELNENDRKSWYHAVFRTLGQLKNKIAAPALLNELHTPLSSDRYYREAIFEALGNIGDEIAVPVLIEELLRWKPEPALVKWPILEKPFPFVLVEALTAIGHPAIGTLKPLLSLSDMQIRICVACILERSDTTRKATCEKILSSAICSTDSLAACVALSGLRCFEKIPNRLIDPVISASRASDVAVRFLATGLLYGRCDRSERIREILRLLESDNEKVVAAAARGDIQG